MSVTEQFDRISSALADRYQIERELGAGGMATVYLAHDRKHERPVAVKVLRPELAATVGPDRFLLEIRTTAQLSHPHILSLIDSGAVDGFLYYVMPYVAGESVAHLLRREASLGVAQAVQITEQVAAALEFAHRRGVIHRDIKPANIMLHEGVAMVADFGIALAVTTAGDKRLTDTGFVTGTPEYMSPEQAAGDRELDARSDVYALGCALYEMLAGAPPFTGPNIQSVIARQITDPVPSLATVRSGIASNVMEAILKALAKVPGDRFDSAAAFAKALRSAPPTPAAHSGTASIAVLPLANLSGDPQQDYFSDGMTEALITDLAKIGALKVISRTSVMRYKGSDKPLPQIASELGVGVILEGSVLKAGNEVRITVQLIDAATDTHIWAESYDRQLTNILSLQGEVAQAVAHEVKVNLTPQEHARLADRKSVNPAAHEAYLKGRFAWNQRGAGLRNSIPFFEESIALDPGHAPAYAGLADAYALLGFYGYEAPRDVIRKAKAAALQALELGPNLAEANASLGYIRTMFEWDWSAGGTSLARAVELNPSYGPARIWYAVWNLAVGKHDQALTELHRGLEHDPMSVTMRMHWGVAHHVRGNYRAAITPLREAIDLSPGFANARALLGLTHHFLHDTADGVRELQRAVELSERELWPLGMLGAVSAESGDEHRAREILRELIERAKHRYVSAVHLATIHAALRETEPSLDWLERAAEERAPLLTLLRYNAYPGWFLGHLRSEPRYQAVERGFGFP